MEGRPGRARAGNRPGHRGLPLPARHPPGTSKWNRIEHRLFCQISLAWRARPLTSYDVIIDTIGAVTAKTGLTAIAVLDENACPTGTETGGEQMRDIEKRCLIRGEWHGEWNYTLLADPPAPEPDPAPASPSRLASRNALNHPALTGLAPDAVQALAAALEVPFGAHRAQHNYARRGRERVNAVRDGGGSNGKRRIDLTDHVLALAIHDHLRTPFTVIGALLGVDRTTAAHAANLARQLAASHAIPLPPAPPQHGDEPGNPPGCSRCPRWVKRNLLVR
jgi:hypothetical protein